jgi:hypothetical protein
MPLTETAGSRKGVWMKTRGKTPAMRLFFIPGAEQILFLFKKYPKYIPLVTLFVTQTVLKRLERKKMLASAAL